MLACVVVCTLVLLGVLVLFGHMGLMLGYE
jgi:hypothetical protein